MALEMDYDRIKNAMATRTLHANA